ncbi:MAG TPA: exonuclease SbcCD subunit D C-terminal domain-containing protein, partial [Geminicoccus sp.]|uniref:exonuclease SbcCD subunit D C-terminal domain-containing protein n=1 Tax=Geminicoccus sp. TaxID=2024832 RepID=UPI002E3592CC
IYDAVNPPTSAQRRLYQFVARVLAEAPGLQIVLTGGNHDSASRLELPRHLLDSERVVIMGAVPRRDRRPDPTGLVVPLRHRTGTVGAYCVAVPYLRPGDLPDAETHETPLECLHRQAVAAADAQRGHLPLVVTGHLHVIGGDVSELSERRVVIGGEEVVPASIYPAHAAYVALGHLHRPQRISGPTEIRYAGSPFPLSVTERDYRHGAVVVDIHGERPAGIALLEAPRLVDFLRIPRAGCAPLAEIEAELLALRLEDLGRDRHAFLEVVVRMDGPEPDLRRRIEQAVNGKPVRLVRVARELASGPAAPLPFSADLAEMAELEVFHRLYHQAHPGMEPADDLTRAFRQLLAEVQAPADEGTAA